MFFHRRKSTANPDNAQAEQVSREPAPVEEPVAEQAQAGQSNSLLFGKFLRNQRGLNGPEASYENEVWAPEIESVGLFHKHRATVEEQSSSPSGPQ